MISYMEFLQAVLSANAPITETEFLERAIDAWEGSRERQEQIQGEAYYEGRHDILRRKRTAIGRDGQLTDVDNLPNNRIVDNQYAKMVDQKANYLLGKPIAFETKSEPYASALKTVFDKRFTRTLRSLGVDSLNGGIAWLHPYYAPDGTLAFKRFAAQEVLPFWKDSDHTALQMAVRMYEIDALDGVTFQKQQIVEVYRPDGMRRYLRQAGKLVPDGDGATSSYMDINGKPYGWGRVPLVAFRFNSKEIPLIRRVKSLQDGINMMLSDFENNMQEDSRNTILILKGHGAENLSEFRQNLATYGVVKVVADKAFDSGLDALTVEVNSENYKAILDLLKNALIENAMGYDAKDDRLSGQPNQMNLQSMYSDIDLDAGGMETEYQAAMEELLWYVHVYLMNAGLGRPGDAPLDIVFNRDILINETEAITNCRNSEGVISLETIVSNHPWTKDKQTELERIAKEKQAAIAAMDDYQDVFGAQREAGGDVDGR